MWIEPNTTIRICKNVPLDPTYDHTIWFGHESAQLDYFISKSKYLLSQQMYQRVQRGYMRVYKRAEDLYDCNYLMFQNTAFGNKWFYAFIKGVEYVNNEVSQINFELDVMQTWYFDYALDQCFVEREHSTTDVVGDNIVPENLELGESVVCDYKQDFDMNDMRVCLLINVKDNYQGQLINNVYTSLWAYYPPSIEDVNEIIQNYVAEGQEDRIIAMYQIPNVLVSQHSTVFTGSMTIPRSSISVDGYIPKNKKLFTYPFCSLLVSNNSGQTATYKFEDWSTDTPNATFEICGTYIPTASTIVYPTNHRGIEKDYDSGLVLNNFPVCAFSGDTFKSWWGQNKNSVAISTLATLVGAGASIGLSVANPALGAASAAVQHGAKVGRTMTGINAATNVASTLAKVGDLKNTPPQVHGQTQIDSLNAGIGRLKYSFYRVTIKREFAEIIDNYFSRYGYACRKNKIPNTHVRENWTYTKTIGCTISGSIPADDATAICEIYNNGITFWADGNNVGNYTLSNNPL